MSTSPVLSHRYCYHDYDPLSLIERLFARVARVVEQSERRFYQVSSHTCTLCITSNQQSSSFDVDAKTRTRASVYIYYKISNEHEKKPRMRVVSRARNVFIDALERAQCEEEILPISKLNTTRLSL